MSKMPRFTKEISIHALREEGDSLLPEFFLMVLISIHALREEGDSIDHSTKEVFLNISIHALREEGDSFIRSSTGKY